MFTPHARLARARRLMAIRRWRQRHPPRRGSLPCAPTARAVDPTARMDASDQEGHRGLVVRLGQTALIPPTSGHIAVNSCLLFGLSVGHVPDPFTKFWPYPGQIWNRCLKYISTTIPSKESGGVTCAARASQAIAHGIL
eukprot:4881225-Pleurochrysis_carterae.AAC.3